MGFIYSSLDKYAGESWQEFDNRIARTLPFVAGRAYFDMINYDACTGEFGVLTKWEDELESLLKCKLPEGGYFIKATAAQSFRLHGLGQSLPVYMKFISQGGRIYPYRTYIMFEGRPFGLEFGGDELVWPAVDSAGEDADSETVLSSQRRMSGSQRRMSGSQQRMFGSQRYAGRFVWNGSQMRMLFGSQGGFRMLRGSQYRMFGSQRYAGRFVWNGSQMRRLLGSQGGFRMLRGSQYRRPEGVCTVTKRQDLLPGFPQEWQLINRNRRPKKRIGGNARFGYGLDLI